LTRDAATKTRVARRGVTGGREGSPRWWL